MIKILWLCSRCCLFFFLITFSSIYIDIILLQYLFKFEVAYKGIVCRTCKGIYVNYAKEWCLLSSFRSPDATKVFKRTVRLKLYLISIWLNFFTIWWSKVNFGLVRYIYSSRVCRVPLIYTRAFDLFLYFFCSSLGHGHIVEGRRDWPLCSEIGERGEGDSS